MKPLLAIMIAAFLSLCAFSKPVQSSDGTLAFRNVDVFDGSRMIRRTTVLVRDGMIRAIGSDITIPSSAQIVDGRGETLLPGFLTRTHTWV